MPSNLKRFPTEGSYRFITCERPEDWPWSSFRHYLTGEVGRIEIESEWTWNRRERFHTPPMRGKRA